MGVRIPMADLLCAVAAELDRLAERTLELHGLVEGQLSGGALSSAVVEEAQSVDFLAQHLEGLGAWLRLLAGAPADVLIDPAELRGRLPLSDLEARLTGASAPAAAADPGDFELF